VGQIGKPCFTVSLWATFVDWGASFRQISIHLHLWGESPCVNNYQRIIWRFKSNGIPFFSEWSLSTQNLIVTIQTCLYLTSQANFIKVITYIFMHGNAIAFNLYFIIVNTLIWKYAEFLFCVLYIMILCTRTQFHHHCMSSFCEPLDFHSFFGTLCRLEHKILV